MELAEQRGITLDYVPPYSPNINLIERLWKFVKRELRSKYYDDFDIFRQRIDSIIDSTSGDNKPRFPSLSGVEYSCLMSCFRYAKTTFAAKCQPTAKAV